MKLIFICCCALCFSACSQLQYYGQAIQGHLEVIQKKRPIAQVLEDAEVDAAIKQKLLHVDKVRNFAINKLALPDNGSYLEYADLARPFVVWSVFATEAYSLRPIEWCYWFVGCLHYRGFYSKEEAQIFSATLVKQGYDTYIASVPAYSTLGWFKDPILNTMMHWDKLALTGVLFHELAHQKIYIKDDSMFNESFATAVEELGIEYWLTTTDQSGLHDWQNRYTKQKNQQAYLQRLVAQTKQQLLLLYTSEQSSAQKQAAKIAIFREMEQLYKIQHDKWGENPYAWWFSQPGNNAKLLAFATYHDLVTEFRAVYEQQDQDWHKFYTEVERISKLNAVDRAAALKQYHDSANEMH